MYPFTILSYIKDLVLFFLVIIVFFYLPGKYLLHRLRLQLTTPEQLSIPIIIGLLFFTLLGYIFSWLHAVFIVIPILLAFDYLCITRGIWRINLDSSHRIAFCIVAVLALIFSLPMLSSGIFGNTAIYRTDDIIHLGYIKELFYHFPPDNPGFSGIPLQGYHFFYDFVLSVITKLTSIRIEYLYFHFVPVLTALLWSFCTYSLLFVWKKNKHTSLWAVFLVLFGGSFGFILRLQGHAEATLGSTFGIDQPGTALLNPPFAISVPLILAGLFFIHEYLKTKKIGWALLLGLTVGLAPMFKVYAGILLVTAFILLTIFEILHKRYAIIGIAILTGLLMFSTYGIFSGKGGYFLFAPLWPPHKVLIDGMPWYGYDEKIYTFGNYGMWWRIVGIELYGVFLYLIGNLGTRAIGMALLLLFWFKRRGIPSLITITLVSLLLVSLVIPLFFLQSIKVYEIIQLAWYAMLFGSLIAAAGITSLLSVIPTRIAKSIVAISILLVTLPSAYENVIHNIYPGIRRVHATITEPYLQMMNYLAEQPDYNATVIELPAKETPPEWLPIMSWYRVTLPYIPAFGNKRSYFHSQNIDFPNVKVEPHIELIAELLTIEAIPTKAATLSTALQTAYEHLRSENIAYIISPFPLVNIAGIKNLKKIHTVSPFILYQIDIDDLYK